MRCAAGFFAALLVEKRGMWGTCRDRAARVLAPLLVGVFTLLPVVFVLMLDLMVALRFDVMEILPDLARVEVLVKELQAAGAPVDQLSIGHLWFLLYRCYFYLAMPACRWLVRLSLPAAPRIHAFLGSPVAFIFFGYLFHQYRFVIFFAWLLVPYDLPAIVKFSVVFAGTTIACFTSYHYLVQRTWVSRFLHGRRFDLDWPWRAARTASRGRS